MSMRAAVFTGPQSMVMASSPMPEPGPGEVLVRTRAIGVCAGDMYIYQGKNPYARYPIIGGHEIAGEVAALGSDVSGFAIGDAVVLEPFIGCGACYACRSGKPNCCRRLQIIGVHRAGGFAEYVTGPAVNLHAVPAGMPAIRASFAEPVAIGVQACRRGDVRAGDDVLILGAGPIGLALIEVARARGARVLVADIAEDRLAFARTLGAEAVLSDEHLLQRVLDRTDGDGMPVVIEATGNARAMESTVQLVAAGGRVVIVGLLPQGKLIEIPGLDLTRKEMTIVGSRASANCFPEALRLLASGAITYPDVATAFALAAAPDVFATMKTDPSRYHKAVLLAG